MAETVRDRSLLDVGHLFYEQAELDTVMTVECDLGRIDVEPGVALVDAPLDAEPPDPTCTDRLEEPPLRGLVRWFSMRPL